MYQFFVDDCQIGKEYVTITGSDVNHIKNVLRIVRAKKSGSAAVPETCSVRLRN